MSENPFAILTREPVPDSRVEVEAVIAGGRARVRRRKSLTAAAAGVAVVLVVGAVALAQPRPGPRPAPVGPPPSPPSPSASSGCAPEPLTGLADAVELKIDPSGRYVVGIPQSADGTVLLDGPGGRQALTSVARMDPVGVNGNGLIIGEVHTDVDGDGYVVEGATTTRLGKPQGALNAVANGVNDAGDVVGDARMPGGKFRAVVWRHGKWSQPQLLATPAGGQSAAFGIGPDGTIVGTVGNGAQPYLWSPDGTGRTLATPAGKPGGLAVRIAGNWADGPVDVLARTRVVPSNGRRISTGPPQWARWNLRTGEVQEVQAGPQSAGGAGLLPDGTVVLNTADGAVLWTDTGTTKVPTPAGYRNLQISGVSGTGRLVGAAFDQSSEEAAFRWDCR